MKQQMRRRSHDTSILTFLHERSALIISLGCQRRSAKTANRNSLTDLLIEEKHRPSLCSANVLLEPAHEVFGDFSTVLFGHHLMAIAGQPDIFEIHVRGLYTCLIEPLGCAVGIRTVIARLSRYIENRDALHVYELVRGFLLNPARDEIRPIRLFLANRPQLGRVFDRGIVMKREIGHAPETPRTRSSPFRLFDGWGDWFRCDDALDQLRPAIRGNPTRRCYARVEQQNDRLAD